jgi:hypothetical protein
MCVASATVYLYHKGFSRVIDRITLEAVSETSGTKRTLTRESFNRIPIVATQSTELRDSAKRNKLQRCNRHEM